MEGYVIIDFPIFIVISLLILSTISILLWKLYKENMQTKFWKERYEGIKGELSHIQAKYYAIRFTIPEIKKEDKNAKH